MLFLQLRLLYEQHRDEFTANSNNSVTDHFPPVIHPIQFLSKTHCLPPPAVSRLVEAYLHCFVGSWCFEYGRGLDGDHQHLGNRRIKVVLFDSPLLSFIKVTNGRKGSWQCLDSGLLYPGLLLGWSVLNYHCSGPSIILSKVLLSSESSFF